MSRAARAVSEAGFPVAALMLCLAIAGCTDGRRPEVPKVVTVTVDRFVPLDKALTGPVRPSTQRTAPLAQCSAPTTPTSRPRKIATPAWRASAPCSRPNPPATSRLLLAPPGAPDS